MDKVVIIIILSVILLGAVFAAFQTGIVAKIFAGPSKPVVVPSGIILFYGDGCPHCQIVDDYIKSNGIDKKVKFSKLEVWYNSYNQQVLAKVAQTCQIKTDTVGVPFLFDGNKTCFVGDVDVNNFLKNAAGIK